MLYVSHCLCTCMFIRVYCSSCACVLSRRKLASRSCDACTFVCMWVAYRHRTLLTSILTIVKFVLKARLQLLECNSLLHTYYPGTYTKSCSRSGFYADTVSHALNGYRENKNSIQKRHNRLASIAVQNVRDRFSRAMILEDQLVQLSYFENNSQPTQVPTVFEHTRPDLCVVDHATRTCLIVEVPVPFDVYVNDRYQSKFNRYLPLC